MRIGFVATTFPALSETFIRREVLALCDAGDRVFVYTCHGAADRLVAEPQHANLAVRRVLFDRQPEALVEAMRADGIAHVHSSLMVAAHRAAWSAARALGVPFTFRVYSGYDVFIRRDRSVFEQASRDPLCAAIVAEDQFMRGWLVDRLGVAPDRVHLIANSFDLARYRLPAPRPAKTPIVVLAIARLVEKKGLHILVDAIRQLPDRADLALWIVGDGPDERRLRAAAGADRRISFLGAVSEDETQRLYRDADIFCLPCVQAANGDADGIATTVLEAMAFELPVVTSDLLSAPYYVRHGVEGLLTPPGDVAAVARAIDELRASRGRRTTLGLAGRARVVDCCDLRTNVAGLRALMADARRRLWRDKIDQLMAYRRTYTHGVQDRHDAIRERTVRFFQPRGRTLDIGCGSGKLRAHLPGGTRYVGCDPMLLPTAGREFAAVSASGEQLPFPDGAFDSVVLYDVLSYVLDPDATLAEAVRVLRRDGTLHVRECVDDNNPMHLNHFTQPDLVRRIAEAVPATTVEREPHTLLVNARRKAARAVTRPLASIAITTYNRRPFLRTCLDSALGQSYEPVEVIVVDDGSTDGSRDVLAQYGGRITTVVCETNGGIARAKNLALRATSPDAAYVAILDSDDYFHPSFIERSVRYLDEHPEVGLVYTDDVVVDANGRTLAERESVEPWNIDCWLRTCNLRGDSWVARRELVMRTDLHDESLACDVDYDLFYQLLERTSFGHLREALVYNRNHSGQTTRNRLELAKCHAANLVTYGYSIEYAYHRARRNPEWVPAIEEGAAIGWLRRQRRLTKVIDAKPA